MKGIMFVYDISDEESFNYIDFWRAENETECNKNIVKLLIGNKCDKNREVSYEVGKEYADRNGMLFYETSAMINYNLKEAFLTIIEEVVSRSKLNKTSY